MCFGMCGRASVLWSGGPFHVGYFHDNSHTLEIKLWFNSIVGYKITTKFCTCHRTTAVIPCAKFHSDHFITTWMRAGWMFHWIWITMEKRSWNWPQGNLLHVLLVGGVVLYWYFKSTTGVTSHRSRMSGMVSHMTRNLPICSTACSSWQQRKHQSTALLILREENPLVANQFPVKLPSDELWKSSFTMSFS